MATYDKSEDEILGLETADSSADLGTGSSKADEDISCIDEDMLLLNSPPPVPAPEAEAGDAPDDLKPKSEGTGKPAVSSLHAHAHGVSDNDDELEIIDDDNDDVEEITDVNENSSVCTDDDDDSLSESELSDGDEEDSEQESDESLSTFMDGKISIFFCQGGFFLWNPDDIQMLREECRIVGKLTGSLPRAPRQNSHLGIPLQLMPEEVKLLIDIDAAVVVKEEPVSHKILSIREAAFENVRASNHKIQQKLYKESRKEDVRQRMSEIIAGKKAKKRKLKTESNEGQVSIITTNEASKSGKTGKRKKKTTAIGGDGEGIEDNKSVENVNQNDSDDHLTVDDIISENADTSEKHSLVQIFTENPWKRNFRPYVEWVFPSTEREVLRYLVFKDLWGRGMYLTSGAKFGGDFLVYPGDPSRFHSHYIAICKSPQEELPSLDIVTYGRQASNVRKTALLCSLERNRKVFYTSLQWTGLS